VQKGRLIVEAARRNKRIVQHGTQSRSRPPVLRAMEYAKSGKIGQVLMAKGWDVQKRRDIGHAQDSVPPPGVDYDTWVGPAEWLPYRENRFHYNWHWHWNFGTGDMGNDGAHQLDQARWALDVDYPVEVSGMGRKLFFKDDQQTPDTMVVTFTYPNNKAIMFELRIWTPYGIDTVENGVEIYGSEGKIQIGEWDRQWGFKVFDAKHKLVLHDNQGGSDFHAANFVECVRSRKAPNAEIEMGHISALHCHLGNIVARTGRNLKFDSKTESIVGDPEAATSLRRKYREHWAVPKGV
jgi:predicted dehydrogenase